MIVAGLPEWTDIFSGVFSYPIVPLGEGLGTAGRGFGFTHRKRPVFQREKPD
jgi:hypothetical protein